MLEVFRAATMNDKRNSSNQGLISAVRQLQAKQTLHLISEYFPSYLRFFDNFLAPLISKSQWGAARFLAGCCGQSPTAQAHVAFL
jgi:hypothetical protein